MIHWKRTKGHHATYNNLIRVFEVAGYRDYADTVRNIFTVDESGKALIKDAFGGGEGSWEKERESERDKRNLRSRMCVESVFIVNYNRMTV